jgi:FKBP-type peptidyl-prolyl cis-trans isomerase FkpA
LLVACNKGSNPQSVKLENEQDKTFYAMGVMLGSNLARLNLTDKELSALYKGLYDSAKGATPAVEMAVYQPKIQSLFRERMQKSAEKAKASGTDYIKSFMDKNKDAKKTPSGLVYQIIKPGDKNKPKAEDTVEVHYHGTLTDGTVFDSSVERKKTVSFPLKLIIPPELGYGDAGAPPKIPGGSTLVFEVELFGIKNPEAPKKK